MPEVCAVDRHALAVGKAAHVVPHDLLVAEGRPAVVVALVDELLEGAAPGSGSEGEARGRATTSWLEAEAAGDLAASGLAVGLVQCDERAVEGMVPPFTPRATAALCLTWAR